jgi:hypothetical protein
MLKLLNQDGYGEEKGNTYVFKDNIKERDNVEDLHVKRKTILK